MEYSPLTILELSIIQFLQLLLLEMYEQIPRWALPFLFSIGGVPTQSTLIGDHVFRDSRDFLNVKIRIYLKELKQSSETSTTMKLSLHKAGNARQGERTVQLRCAHGIIEETNPHIHWHSTPMPPYSALA